MRCSLTLNALTTFPTPIPATVSNPHRRHRSRTGAHFKTGWIVWLVLALSTPGVTSAGSSVPTFVVTRFDDPPAGACLPADCSLREAIVTANATGESNITLSAGTYLLLLTGDDDLGLTGDLDVASELYIFGAGREDTFVEAANGDRVFHALAGSFLSLNSLTITGGTTIGTGGGLYAESSGFLGKVALRANHAEEGGGMWFAPGVELVLLLDDVIVADNTASSLGGGIGITGGHIRITHSTIESNEAGVGGGIFHSGGELDLSASTLTDNEATDGGGLLDYSGGATLTNVTVSGNRATSTGGGILNRRVSGSPIPTLRLYNVTVTGNQAGTGMTGAGDGGGLRDEGGFVLLANSILAANADLAGGAPDCSTSSTLGSSFGFNLVGDGSGCGLGFAGSDLVGTVAAPIDPRLSSLGSYGGPTATHALLSGSPAIDGGDPAGCMDFFSATLDFDQRSHPRPLDDDGDGIAVCDIGAFESVQIFVDGFESGDVSEWSSVAP